MKRRYTLVLLADADEGGYVVTVPALPGCVTQPDTVEQALQNAQEVIELYLQEALAGADYLPIEPYPPTIASVEVEVPADIETAAG